MTIAINDSALQPAYLTKLNAEQRLAVEHGDGRIAGPLLVIAGAGSGKTNTLAHRVAHLIVRGADPRRILLMTFSRRAAAGMIKRVERISRQATGDNAGRGARALSYPDNDVTAAGGPLTQPNPLPHPTP